MKNKRTVIFISKEGSPTVAAAGKEYLQRYDDVLSILLSDREFENAAVTVARDYLFKKLSVLKTACARVASFGEQRRFDKLPNADDKFNSAKTSYQKMVNVIERYNPELIVLTTPSVIAEAVAARSHTGHPVRIHVAIDGYVLNKQYANPNADGFFVDNESLAAELGAAGISAAKITVCGLPTRRAFATDAEDVFGTLGADDGRPILLIAHDKSDTRFAPFRAQNGFKAIEVHDDDKEDLNVFFSRADVILCPPEPRTIAKALQKNKPLILFGANTHAEKKTGDFIGSDFALYCKTPAEVQNALDAYLAGDKSFDEKRALVTAASTRVPFEAFGEALAALITPQKA